MLDRFSGKLDFTPHHQQTLATLVIDDHQPGAILHDFDAILTFLSERKPRLTDSHQLPLHMLPDINARLKNPIELGLKRPVQKSYPHIQGLYLLVRASGLSYVDESGKKPVLVIGDSEHRQWSEQNPTEHYGNLLETWLLRGNSEIIGERGLFLGSVSSNYHSAASFYVEIPDDGLAIAGNRDWVERLKYTPDWHNFALLDLFGFIRVIRGNPVPGQGWQIERVYRTSVGDTFMSALYSTFFKNLTNIFELEDAGEVPFGALHDALQPYLPEWRSTLVQPQWTVREGICTFKVLLGSAWRRIVIGADQELDTLATAILHAFKFNNDHLYRFSYRNRFGFMQHVNHPYLEEPPDTVEVAIGELPLSIGQKMIFLFDFGDNWEFEVLLEAFDSGKRIKRPKVVEQHGDPPEQYPDWDK